MTTLRENLVQSAVNFLKDPAVQNSTLQKRVAFLESKGLTSEEIEEALGRLKGGTPNPAAVILNQPGQPGQPGPPPPVLVQPPPVPRIDWRDYFIGAVLIGGIGYAIAVVAKKYLFPLLKTPTANDLENDRKALDKQFTTATERLDLVKQDTLVVRQQIEEQSLSVKQSLDALNAALEDLKQQETKRDLDIKSMKEDIDNVRDLIPKILEKSKDTQTQSLVELQTELKSLKSLILNRRATTPIISINDMGVGGATTSDSETLATSPTSMIPSSFSNVTGSRPSIPAWQLGNTDTSSKDPVEPKNSVASEITQSSSSSTSNSVAVNGTKIDDQD